MSLESRWCLDASALAARCRIVMRLLAVAGVVLAVACLDGSLPAPAGLALAGLTLVLAVLVPGLGRLRRALRAARSGSIMPAPGADTKGKPAELCVDFRGQVVTPLPSNDREMPLRPIRWHRGPGRLWIALRDARGHRAVLSGRLLACDDASAARLDAWLLWLRRGPHG